MLYQYNEDEAAWFRDQLAERIKRARSEASKESMLHLQRCIGTEGPIDKELANRRDWPELINTIMNGPAVGEENETGIL